MKKNNKKHGKKTQKKSFKRKFREFIVALEMEDTRTGGKVSSFMFFALCSLCVLAIILICIWLKIK